MSRIDRMPLFVALLAVAVVGCKDSTTEPAEPLNMEETEALYFALQAIASDTMPEVISTTSDGAVFACSLGGQVTAVIDIREEMLPDTARLTTNITINPEGCVVSSEGYEFTLDGNPNVQIGLTLAITSSPENILEFLIDGSMTGGVDWELEDRSGICMIDLTFTTETDPVGTDPALKGSVSGMMCGLEVEFDTEIGVPTMGG